MKCIKFLTKFTDILLHCSRRASSRYLFGFIWCFVILFPNSHYMCSSFKLDDYGRIGNVWGALYQQSLTYINIYSWFCNFVFFFFSFRFTISNLCILYSINTMAATIIALAVSTLYIVFTSLIAYWMRRYTNYYIQDPFVRSLFLEGIATGELCGACFELIIGKFTEFIVNNF